MAQNSSGGALIAASLILGAALLAGSYLVASSIDRGAAEVANLKGAIQTAAAAQPAAKPAAPTPRSRRPDPNRVYDIQLGKAPIKGSAKAAITVVEYSDFQCPFCARVTPTLQQVQKEYGDQVRIAFKHLPLSIHPKAPAAHAAAEAAKNQGKFWEMHDKIFANQREMSEANYVVYATQLGLDVDKFKSDVASSDTKKRIDADKSEASRLGVTGTPAFFVNGRFLSGNQPFASFKRLIDEELAKKKT
jgi:protein-disulfide isomerase